MTMAINTTKTTLSSDEAAMMVASAGIEFGADPDKLLAAFKADSGGQPVTFQGDPKETARKIAMQLSGTVPKQSSQIPADTKATSSISYQTKERGTAEQRGTFQQTAAEAEATTRNLLSAFDTASSNTQKAISAYGSAAETSGKANAVLAYTKVGAQAEQARAQEALLTSAGINATDAQSLINRRIMDAEDLRSQREVLANQINANSQIDPLKDPFGWFIGQLKNEVTIGQHNSLVRTENAALQDISDRQKLVANQLSISPAASSENLRQIQLAQTAAISTEAETIAQKAKVDANRAVVSDLVERMRLSNIPLDIQAQVIKLQTTTDMASAQLSDVKQKDDAETEELRLINEPRNRYMFEAVNKTTAKMMSPVERQLWIKLGSGQALGDSPGEHLAALKFMGIGPEQMTRVDQRKAQAMNDLQEGGKQWLGSLQAVAGNMADPVKADAAKAELKKLKGGPETIVASVDGYLTDQLTDFVSGKAQPNNIYKLRIGDASLKGEFADNSVTKAILSSDARKSPTFGDAEALAVVAATARKDVKSIPKLADDMAKLYSNGLKTQFADKGYGTLGIKLPDGYPAMIGGKQTNLMSKASIEQYLLIQVTQTEMMPWQAPEMFDSGGTPRIQKSGIGRSSSPFFN
jgi:hypothetical protein